MGDTYKVGYRKPPEKNQFRKGRSGNPKGRPKNSINANSLVKELAEEKISIALGGKQTRVSSIMAILLRMRNAALQGDVKAGKDFLNLYEKYAPQDSREPKAMQVDVVFVDSPTGVFEKLEALPLDQATNVAARFLKRYAPRLLKDANAIKE